MQNKKEFFGNGGTVTLYQNGGEYIVDCEIERAPGIFKCTSVPFMDEVAAKKYYENHVKSLQGNKNIMMACGIFEKKR